MRRSGDLVVEGCDHRFGSQVFPLAVCASSFSTHSVALTCTTRKGLLQACQPMLNYKVSVLFEWVNKSDGRFV